MSLVSLGFLLLIFQAIISWLSRFFIFGIGHSDRPILEFILLEVISFVIYFMAIEHVRRIPAEKKSSSWVLIWIFSISILCRLVYFPSNLIQETDPYRYVWDGQTVIQGENPYRYSPKEVFEAGGVPIVAKDQRAVETFRKINHAGVRTVYPPLAQYLFAFAQWLSAWNLDGLRMIVFAAECLSLWLMALALGQLGIRKEWILLYGWSPLILKEFSNSLHIDAFAVLFLSAMLYCLIKKRFKPAYFFLALATLVKWFALALLPLLILWTLKKSKRQAVAGTFLYVLTCLLFYFPYLNAGIFLFEGLGRFAVEWQVNESVFGVISHLVSLIFSEKNLVSGLVARGVSSFTFLFASVLVLKWLSKQQPLHSFFQACLIVIASLFFLAPTGNPWYYTWIFPFFYFLPLRSLILFSGLAFLYYFDFYSAYHGKGQLFQWIRLVEYGIFFLTLGLELWKKYQPFQLSFRSQTKERLLAARSVI